MHGKSLSFPSAPQGHLAQRCQVQAGHERTSGGDGLMRPVTQDQPQANR